MSGDSPSREELLREIEQLRQRLEESEETVRAIRGGEVDAFLVRQGADDQVLVLEGVDRPYRAVIEQMQQGAVTTSAEGTILYFNPRFASLLGRTSSSLVGADLCACAPAEERPVLAELLRNGQSAGVERELDLEGADGTRVPVNITVSPVTVNAGVLSLIVTDLTEPKRRAAEGERFAQERAARSAAEATAAVLRDADRRKDEFLAMLAHELRTPLTPLRNGLEMLDTIGSKEPQPRQVRDMMKRQVEMLVRLVDDLLDVGRVTQGKIVLQRQRADLATVIEMALENARGVIGQRGHRLEVALPDEPLPVEVDVVRVAQIVINLLHNAAKFTPRGGKITLAVERARTADEAIVRVRDDGIGIRPEMLPRLFELFVQADPTLSRSEGGLGIGLTLARCLAELHGGRLEGASAGIGRGSEFTVRLPLATGAAAKSEAPAPAPASGPRRSVSPLRVLIVDDNVDAANSLAFLLRLRGHTVRHECDGVRALAAAAEFLPDLVLLDIGLPGMDGYEVARRLQSQPATRAIRIVALSGYGSEEDRERSRAAGFLDHFVKPVEFSVLEKVLASVEQSAAKAKAAGLGA